MTGGWREHMDFDELPDGPLVVYALNVAGLAGLTGFSASRPGAVLSRYLLLHLAAAAAVSIAPSPRSWVGGAGLLLLGLASARAYAGYLEEYARMRSEAVEEWADEHDVEVHRV